MVRHAAAHKHLHKKKSKGPFDYLVYFFMVATPLFELPQAISIFQNQSAESVSVYTWVFFFISSIVMAIYAARNKLYPFVVTYCMYILAEGTVVIGILLYG